MVLPTYEKVPTRPVAVITVATCSYSDEYFEFGTKSILSSQFEMCLAETCQCRETSQNGAQLYPLQTAVGRLIALEAFESGAFNCIMFHSSLCFICMVNLIFKHTSCYHCTSYWDAITDIIAQSLLSFGLILIFMDHSCLQAWKIYFCGKSMIFNI